jgi:Galactose oxidase, central domain
MTKRTLHSGFFFFSLALLLAFFLKGSGIQVPSGTWAPAGNMAEARSGAASALLQDGTILVTGGESASVTLATAEFFNAGAFSVAPAMNVARSGHAAVTLLDGRVLVTGGKTTGGGVTNAAEIYAPALNSWIVIASMADARSGHTATVLKDGLVLLAGGEGSAGALSTLEVFDPVEGTFTFAGAMSSARKEHAAALLDDGRALIAGGSDGANALASTQIYDPETGAVAPGPAMSTPRAGLSATTLLDGKVLIAGGNSGTVDLATAEIFDPATGNVSTIGSSLVAARRDHSAFLLPNNNHVLIVGGTSGGTASAMTELFRPWDGNFYPTGSMSTARAGSSGSPLGLDGLLVVPGGNGVVSSELYGFATVKTDKADYRPGALVTITGSGWQPGEAVTLLLHEINNPDPHDDLTLTATADASGGIFNNQFAPDEHDLGVRFYLTATGQSSGQSAQNTFTDDQVVNNIDASIDPALETATITSGGSVSVDFFIQPSNTIPAGDANGCNSTGANPATVTLSVPAGVTASTTSLTFTGCGVEQSVTFSSSTPNTYNITVASVTGGKAGSLWDTAPASFQLVVNPPANAAPSSPTALAQFKADGTTSISTGGATNGTTVVLKGSVTDPDTGNTVKLQVEVRPVGTLFTNTMTAESSLLASGSTASATVMGLVNGTTYHWQARSVDNNGEASAWGPFGGNPETDTDFRVDTTPPKVTTVTSSKANGAYTVGESIPIQVTFDEVVNVTGTPTLTLETGTTDAVVNYTSGSGTNTLTFTYTVAAGHTSADLDYVSTAALALNGGTIKDGATNDADLTLPAPGGAGSLGANKNIVIDTTAPKVTNVTSSKANGAYTVGESIPVQVVFDEVVNVTGTPTLTLETGTTDAVVNYTSGSGTDTLTFNYTVAAGHTSTDLDYVSAVALALNGGTIKDAATNDANLSLPAPGAAGSLGANKNIVIDTTPPKVTNVTSSKANGAYTVGESIPVQVTFDEVVNVTGTPTLTLETGATDGVASYTSGTGSNTLTFTYTVGAGHTSTDLDYVSTAALALNGGTIKDAATNDANLSLPAPGAAGSLGANKNIVIDTTPPETTLTVKPPLITSNTSATFEFTGSDNFTPVASLTFECQLDGGGFSPCSSPKTYSGLAAGINHTFDVRAKDLAGNTDSTPETYTWHINAGPSIATSCVGTPCQTVQYSDPIADVTITATDADSPGSSLTAGTSFKKDGGSAQAGLPTGLSFVLDSTTVGPPGSRSWKLTGIANVAAGSYETTITVSDNCGPLCTLTTSTIFTIVVTQENAQILYTGVDTVAQVGATLTLRATVWDSAANGYAGTNPESGAGATIGDITKMWIAFDIYSAGSCSSGSPIMTKYGQVTDTGTAGDGIGTATQPFTASSENSYCVVATLVANGSGGTPNLFYEADPAQPVGLAFYNNTGQFVTAGGWIYDSNPSHGNFGLNARNNKNGQAQGQMVYVYRGLYNGVPANYIIKSNSLTNFGIASGAGGTYPMAATLQGKCNLEINRASDGAVLFSEGNATFSATVIDTNQNSGSGSESYAVTVYNKDAVLYKSVAQSLLQGGNVVVHIK